MPNKIYNRQAPNISTHSPVTEPVNTNASEIFSNRAKQAANVAAQNFALGQKQVLDGIIDYGYAKAADNPIQFVELTEEAFKKQVEGLPENMRQKMTENFYTAQKNRLLKVENNFIAKQDNELKQNSEANLSSLSNNMQIANENLYTALANGRYDDAKIAKQQLDNLKRQGVAQSDITLSNGSFVYAKSDREKIKNGTLYDAQYDFQTAIDSMSMERLKEWDAEVFQNRIKWQQETGIDKKTYDSQSKYIKERLKALGSEEDRIIKSDAEFVASELIINYEPDKMKELEKKGIVNEELLKAIKNVGENPKSVSEVINTYKFAETMKQLEPIITDTDDSEEGNQRRFAAATKLLNDYSLFAKDTGLDIEEQENYLGFISKGLSDKQFSEAIQPIFADSALRDNFFTLSDYFLGKPSVVERVGRAAVGFIENRADDLSKRNAKSIADDYVKAALTFAVGREYDKAKQILQEGNRQVIRARAAPYINNMEFDRLESEFNSGKKAYFTTEYGGTYEFLGYSNKDAIFKAVK